MKDTSLRSLLHGLLLTWLALARSEDDGSERRRGWYWSAFVPGSVGPTTFLRRDDWVLASNLFFHVNRFRAIVPATEAAAPRTTRGDDFSFNTPVVALPVKDVPAFYANLRAGWVGGTTLWVDFPFSSVPTHVGHWVETLAPVYSHLSSDAWRADAGAGADPPRITALLVPGLRRSALAACPAALEMLSIAVAPGLAQGQPPPRLLFWDDLAAANTSTWLGFSRALRIYSKHDRPGAPRYGFASPRLADAFRGEVYAAADIAVPPPAGAAAAAPPRTITFLMAAARDKVANNGEVLAALRAVGAAAGMRVRPYTTTTAAPLASLASVMAATGVLVARNGPLLGAAVLLPPGAAVIELLPHNWEFGGVNELYRNLTASVGDVAHVAWRAPGPEFMEYATPSDARYARWTPAECTGPECLGAQEHAALRVDPEALERLAAQVAAAVARGDGPEAVAARHPWPPRFKATAGGTGLWWDLA